MYEVECHNVVKKCKGNNVEKLSYNRSFLLRKLSSS